MSNPYKKETEKDPLDPQTVFKIKHSEIPQGITQCVKHTWKKRNDNEIECTKCPTILICSSDYINELFKDQLYEK